MLLFSHSCVQLFVTPWTVAHQGSLSTTIFQSLFKLMSIESGMPFNYLILCLPLLFLPSVFPNIRVFSNELTLCIRWPEYCSFSFNISPSHEYSGLISFRTGWFDLAIQGTLKSLLQHHSSKASTLWHSAFFMLQVLHDYWKKHNFDYTNLCWQGMPLSTLIYNSRIHEKLQIIPSQDHVLCFLDFFEGLFLLPVFFFFFLIEV